MNYDKIIDVSEDLNLYELYFIKDVLRAKYGSTDYHNFCVKVHIPPELYKKFQQIATFLDTSITDFVRYIVYKIVQYVEKNNMFNDILDEIHLRKVLLKRGKGGYREIRFVPPLVDEVEKSILDVAKKILESRFKYRIVDEKGFVNQSILLFDNKK